MNENQDSFFRDKLYDLESPLNERVSFEEVMERRKKKRRFIFWWNPKVYVVAGLFVVGGLGMYLANPFDEHRTPVSTKDLTTKVVSSNAKKAAEKNGQEKSSTENASNQVENYNKGLTQSQNAKMQIENHRGIHAQSEGLKIQTDFQSDNSSQINLRRDFNRKQTRRGYSLINENQTGIFEDQIFETSKEYLKLSHNKSATLEDFLSGKSSNLADKQYTWNNQNEIIRSLSLTQLKIQYPHFDWASFNIDLDIPDRPMLPKMPNSKWYAELSVITGSNNTINFEENVPLSVLGTQYMAQYQLLLLKDLENGSMLGAGIQYSEWVGNGQWQLNKNEMIQRIDTNVVRISAPWQPKRYVTIIDTSYVPANNVQTGNIEYRIGKISFPFAYRFYTQIAKTPIRVGFHLAPGYTTVNSGTYFTTTDYRPIDQARHLTFDGKLSIGPMIPVTKKWTFVIEPSIMYQSFLTDNNATVNGKFFTGLGIAILRKL